MALAQESRLAGKRAIVSGGSTGIGAATVRRFVAEGAAVTVLDMNVEDGLSLASDLARDGGRVHVLACNVGDPEQVARAVEESAAWLGGIDVVFANAGVGTMVVGGTIETIEPDRWDLAFDVNARGVYALCRAAMPYLRATGGGSIVITSSSSALVGVGSRPTHAYTAAKGALLALTRAMAVSYGPDGVRVNALVPGFVRTRLTEDVVRQPQRLREAVASIPLRRIAEPDEIAACVAFLASDDASFVTGAMLVADGGQTVQ